METRPDAQENFGTGQAVIEAARKAWEWHGTVCHVRTNDSPDGGVVGALDLPERRQVEVVIESAVDGVWGTLANWALSEEWNLRAVVPRRALGIAHDALRQYGFELQGYWMHADGRVEFGPVEIA